MDHQEKESTINMKDFNNKIKIGLIESHQMKVIIMQVKTLVLNEINSMAKSMSIKSTIDQDNNNKNNNFHEMVNQS